MVISTLDSTQAIRKLGKESLAERTTIPPALKPFDVFGIGPPRAVWSHRGV
jgi:hypothetical protein